jgi:hypothetical protein
MGIPQALEIAPVSESTGKVAVIDGAGACPREDGGTNRCWDEEPCQARVTEPINVREGAQENLQCVELQGKNSSISSCLPVA